MYGLDCYSLYVPISTHHLNSHVYLRWLNFKESYNSLGHSSMSRKVSCYELVSLWFSCELNYASCLEIVSQGNQPNLLTYLFDDLATALSLDLDRTKYRPTLLTTHTQPSHRLSFPHTPSQLFFVSIAIHMKPCPCFICFPSIIAAPTSLSLSLLMLSPTL